MGDVDDMSRNIINIFQDGKAFEEMKKHAIEQAQKFDIDTIVPEYEKLYKKVTGLVNA